MQDTLETIFLLETQVIPLIGKRLSPVDCANLAKSHKLWRVKLLKYFSCCNKMILGPEAIEKERIKLAEPVQRILAIHAGYDIPPIFNYKFGNGHFGECFIMLPKATYKAWGDSIVTRDDDVISYVDMLKVKITGISYPVRNVLLKKSHIKCWPSRFFREKEGINYKMLVGEIFTAMVFVKPVYTSRREMELFIVQCLVYNIESCTFKNTNKEEEDIF